MLPPKPVRFRLIFLVALAACSAPGFAQTTTPATAENPDRKDTVVLNPFEVVTEKDTGYVAANSLAGGRANTPLKLTPASISVMTREFMDDFNVNNLTEAINWTVNVQMRDPAALDSSPFGQFEVNFRNAGGSQGIPTRNYFRFYFNSDSYNTERMEFSRGPNSLLFGDANMGGIAGSLTKQARYNNHAKEARFQVDSFGGYRTTGDFNYGLDRFAIRINTVFQRLKGFQKGTFTKNEGIHGAISYKLFDQTQFRVEGEWNSTRASIYRRYFNENASYWDRTLFNENNSLIPTATATAAGLEQISATNTYLVFNFNNPEVGVLDYSGNQYRTRGTGFLMPWEGRTDIPNFANLPSKDFRLGPADAFSERVLNTWSAFLEHNFNEDWAAQLGYQRVVYGPSTRNTESVGGDYRIDVNRLLPDGRPNPNVGKAYTEVVQSNQYQENAQDDVRLTTSFRFSRPKLFNWNIDLKQRFSLIGGFRFDRFELWQGSMRRVNNPLVPNPTDARNQVRYRIYWDNPNPSIGSAPPVVPGMIFAEVESGNPTRNQRQLYYGQIASSTFLFNDRLSVIAGLRQDRLRLDNFMGIGQDPVTGRYIKGNFNPATGRNEAGFHLMSTPKATTKSIGSTAWVLPWIALNANYSTNFAPAVSGSNKIDGSAMPSPQGTGRDLGLKFSLLDGRVYATASYYNANQVGAPQNGQRVTELNRIWTNLGYTDPARTAIAYRDTTSFTTQGYEFEVTANVTRGFRMTANYALPKRNLLDTSPGLKAYFAEHVAEWQAAAAAATANGGTATVNGRTVVNPTIITTDVQNIKNDLDGIQIGVLANDTLKWTSNIAGTYSFHEGRLKGFSIGGGVQLRGPRKQGNRDAQLKFATATPTVLQTFESAFDYLYVPSTTLATAHMSYERRFGQKIRARFQLNVSNLLNDNTPQWNGFSTLAANQLLNGNPRQQVLSGFNEFDPRKFTLSTTFSF